MADRKALSKRTRFEVFKRDGFRCVYCGSTPNDGPLHVDHVEAVANGGTDDLDNLVTACAACNLGKSSVPLERRAPNQDPEAAAEQAEQVRAWAEAQRSVIAAKKNVEQEMVNLWCDTFGTNECDREVPGRMLKLLNEWPMAKLCEALQICADNGRLYDDVRRLKYLYGILRNWRAVAAEVERQRARDAAWAGLKPCACCGAPIPKGEATLCARCDSALNAEEPPEDA